MKREKGELSGKGKTSFTNFHVVVSADGEAWVQQGEPTADFIAVCRPIAPLKVPKPRKTCRKVVLYELGDASRQLKISVEEVRKAPIELLVHLVVNDKDGELERELEKLLDLAEDYDSKLYTKVMHVLLTSELQSGIRSLWRLPR